MAEAKIMRGGDIAVSGGRAMAVVESGAAGLTEVEAHEPPPPPKPQAEPTSLPPIIQTFSEMAIRANRAANTQSSKGQSAEQGA